MDKTTTVCEEFSQAYPNINNDVLNHGTFEPSRYGDTREMLGYKTVIKNPVARCVGGFKRDINVFFLMAEAIWIFAGKKDVEFLTVFNSRMSEFSDDGKTFHAPYGFRLRHWGIDSESLDIPQDGNKHAFQGQDQIRKAVELLSKSSESRRVVLSIWNPELDLFNEKPTKDTPCNDLLMLKVRDNRLNVSISNRSNDLHWGLPTNVFQFSFVLEVLAKVLNLKVGQQQHNSDSLHIYVNNDNNKIHETMSDCWRNGAMTTQLYDIVKPSEMDFDFSSNSMSNLSHVDDMFNHMINSLSFSAGIKQFKKPIPTTWKSSKYFSCIYSLLLIYIEYTQTKRNDDARLKAIFQICSVQYHNPTVCHDYVVLALNWFHSRLKNEEAAQASRSEINMLNLVPELSYINYNYVGTL